MTFLASSGHRARRASTWECPSPRRIKSLARPAAGEPVARGPSEPARGDSPLLAAGGRRSRRRLRIGGPALRWSWRNARGGSLAVGSRPEAPAPAAGAARRAARRRRRPAAAVPAAVVRRGDRVALPPPLRRARGRLRPRYPLPPRAARPHRQRPPPGPRALALRALRVPLCSSRAGSASTTASFPSAAPFARTSCGAPSRRPRFRGSAIARRFPYRLVAVAEVGAETRA